MSIDTLEKMYLQLGTGTTKEISIIWHGGEPLLAGIDFYKQAKKFEKKYLANKTVRNSIQSNGTLIDKSWCEFFRDNNFSVGISIDGDRPLNAQRIFPNGKESFHYTLSGIHLLKKHKVRYGILSVVCTHISGHETELYHFLRRITHSARLNIVVPSGIGKLNTDRIEIQNTTSSLLSIYHLWKADRRKELLSISPFSEIIKSLLTRKTYSCAFSSEGCCRIISISHDGLIFSCGRFSQNANFLMGNIEDGIMNILNSPVASLREERIKSIQSLCSDCKYLSICNGGCAHEAYAMNGCYTKNSPFCSIYKSLFSEIEKDLREAGYSISI